MTKTPLEQPTSRAILFATLRQSEPYFMIILQLESLTPPFVKWGCFTIPIPWIQVIYYLVLKAVFSYFIYCLILFLILLIFFLFVRDTILTDILMTTNEAVHIFSFFSCAMITTVVSYHHCLSPSGCYMTGMAWVKNTFHRSLE